jgi:hypothetical protein
MRQASDSSSPGDAIAAFLDTLRRFVAFACVCLINVLQGVVCSALLLVGLLPPWRCVPLLCCGGGDTVRPFKPASMKEFRETSCAFAERRGNVNVWWSVWYLKYWYVL